MVLTPMNAIHIVHLVSYFCVLGTDMIDIDIKFKALNTVCLLSYNRCKSFTGISLVSSFEALEMLVGKFLTFLNMHCRN